MCNNEPPNVQPINFNNPIMCLCGGATLHLHTPATYHSYSSLDANALLTSVNIRSPN